MRAPQYGQSPYSVHSLKLKGYRLIKSKMKPTEGGMRFTHYQLKRPDGSIAYDGNEQQELFAIVKEEHRNLARRGKP